MIKLLNRLESNLERLGGDSDHQDPAVLALREPIETLTGSPIEEDVRCILAGVVSDLESREEAENRRQEQTHSDRLRRLQKRYTSAIDHHPAIALQLGRLADALAVLGV